MTSRRRFPCLGQARALVIEPGGGTPRIAGWLRDAGFRVDEVDAAAAEGLLRRLDGAVLVCLATPGGDAGSGGRAASLLRVAPEAILVWLAGTPCLDDAVAALRLGAAVYAPTPGDPEALRSILDQAEQAASRQRAIRLRAMSRMMPGLVHEFRNPLSGILGAGQMLGRLLPAGGTAREYVEMVRDEAAAIERFLARLAQFGRLHPGQLQRVAGVRVTDLVERTLHEALPRCQAQGVQVVREMPPDPPGLCVDAGRLQVACAQLVENALDAMPRGGRLEARVGPLTDDVSGERVMEIAFTDDGSGLQADAEGRAGEPFYSTRSRALGVGVCLAQAVATAHGGSVTLECGEGGGTRARLRLPLGEGAGDG